MFLFNTQNHLIVLEILKYYSPVVDEESKTFVLLSLLPLVDGLYTVIHKVQKTRTKVLPSAMTGEYIVLYLSKTENIYSKLKISLNFVAPCEYLNFTDTYTPG